VRWIDATIDPNGRKPNHCYLGDPRVANVGPVGMARFTTCRSWLSQWSYDLSNAKGTVNAAKIKQVPVLQIVNQADDAVPATHNPAIRAALAAPDKEYVEIQGATHYYLGQPEQLQRCIDTVTDWSRRKELLA
jgi:pimeloyl-ACP methyl ester carboxylesterase